jgi:hypothetical protein
MSAEPCRRISITKMQRETAAGAELISLCQTVTEDGTLSDDEVAALKLWLVDNKDIDLPAKNFLYQTVEKILADGKVTSEERSELYQAIETILPPDVRGIVRGTRKAIEKSAREQLRAERDAAHAAVKEARLRSLPLEAWDFMVAGARYENRPSIIAQYANPGDIAYLARDPENQYSRNAVEVRLQNGMQIGFVPEEHAVEMAPLLDAGQPHEAYIKKILTGGRNPIPVIVASVSSPDSDRANVVYQENVPTKVDVVFQKDVPSKVVASQRSGCAAVVTAFVVLLGAAVVALGFWR